jgi:hypothetical protein
MKSADHDIPAPDMSDPRNYIKSLEELEKRGFDYQINFSRASCESDVERSHYIQIGHSYWEDGGIKDKVADGESATMATAIMNALAALYDAEHREPTSSPLP